MATVLSGTHTHTHKTSSYYPHTYRFFRCSDKMTTKSQSQHEPSKFEDTQILDNCCCTHIFYMWIECKSFIKLMRPAMARHEGRSVSVRWRHCCVALFAPYPFVVGSFLDCFNGIELDDSRKNNGSHTPNGCEAQTAQQEESFAF